VTPARRVGRLRLPAAQIAVGGHFGDFRNRVGLRAFRISSDMGKTAHLARPCSAAPDRAAPKRDPEPATDVEQLQADIDAAIEACGGDLRLTISALLEAKRALG
jgi:hypothetical protein